MNTLVEKCGRQPSIRTVPMPSDLNANGHIFGGWILSQMDLAAGGEAISYCNGPVATVAITGMQFHQPVLPGDLLSVYTDVVKVGTTSITIHIEVMVLRRGNDKEIKVTEGDFVFVSLDEAHRPKKIDKEA
ncbi:acyl-CoA thioesterase [Paremcibacter congregatus]|uniref:Acyl-CoA thioesterase n=2 Tax=Paremcibacter congregatus TaxID=2043170 RepID=A0A2G4YNB2_9PROT|nr:acyl-CoA thioesterase [Paremcibacter congregatus]QDE27491.1 acyl-CoA thioesterase [Paremcibacter congregatus]|tara:strand:+ start:2791 stop:3183 length:393 start_codon:yes stop_codon:yes gene_type:complete